MTGFQDLITAAGKLIDSGIVILLGVGLLIFLWGLVKFLFRVGSDGDKAVEEGKNRMVWGLIALFVMLSVWGLVKFIQANLGITTLTL
jgi:hypothetical protein